jgi:hypothetical protein
MPSGTPEAGEKNVADLTQEKPLSEQNSNQSYDPEEPSAKRRWYWQIWDSLKTPGSAPQIITAALISIAIGLAVSTSVDNIPEAAPVVLEIPGQLWLRALRATGELPA